MKKGIKAINVVTIYIIVAISFGMVGTYIHDYLDGINWFGDVDYVDRYGYHKEEYGARHYWFCAGIFLLYVVAFIRMIMIVVSILPYEHVRTK